jgi:hypothetical protein
MTRDLEEGVTDGPSEFQERLRAATDGSRHEATQ